MWDCMSTVVDQDGITQLASGGLAKFLKKNTSDHPIQFGEPPSAITADTMVSTGARRSHLDTM